MEEFRKILLDKKAELEKRLKDIAERSAIPLDTDSGEASLELQNEEVLNGLDEEAREELHDIEIALRRLDNNVYNICVGCKETIPLARLKANPFCQRCIDCAKEDAKEAS